MARRARRTHNPVFKAKVALAAIKGEKTLASGQQYDVTPSRYGWRAQVLDGAAGLFGGEAVAAAPAVDIKVLQCEDRRTDAGERVGRCAQQSGLAQRKAIIDRATNFRWAAPSCLG